MSEIVTPQMNPFEIPENHPHSYPVSNNSISKKLKELIINPYYYCFPGDIGCRMIEDCLKKDPSIAFEELDLNGRKLLNYVALWCNDTDECVALIRKIKEMGGDVNYRRSNKWPTPLNQALRKGHLKKIKVLLELGAKIEDRDKLTNLLDEFSEDWDVKKYIVCSYFDLQKNIKNAQKSLEDEEILYENLQKQKEELENKIRDQIIQIEKKKIKISQLEEKIMGEKENLDEYKKSPQDALNKKKSTILALLNKYEK